MGRSWIVWAALFLVTTYLLYNKVSSDVSLRETMAPFSKTDATLDVRTRVMTFVTKFNSVWDDSFKHGQATRETIRTLVGIAAQTQDALYTVKAALPSDTSLHTLWKTTAESIQMDHFTKLEDLRKRCGAPLLYPEPLDDVHYRKWWRAANYYDDDAGVSPL